MLWPHLADRAPGPGSGPTWQPCLQHMPRSRFSVATLFAWQLNCTDSGVSKEQMRSAGRKGEAGSKATRQERCHPCSTAHFLPRFTAATSVLAAPGIAAAAAEEPRAARFLRGAAPAEGSAEGPVTAGALTAPSSAAAFLRRSRRVAPGAAPPGAVLAVLAFLPALGFFVCCCVASSGSTLGPFPATVVASTTATAAATACGPSSSTAAALTTAAAAACCFLPPPLPLLLVCPAAAAAAPAAVFLLSFCSAGT